MNEALLFCFGAMLKLESTQGGTIMKYNTKSGTESKKNEENPSKAGVDSHGRPVTPTGKPDTNQKPNDHRPQDIDGKDKY